MAEFDVGRARQDVLDVLGMALGERGPDVEALDAGLRLGLDYTARNCAAEDREVVLPVGYAGDNRLDLDELLEGEPVLSVVALYRQRQAKPRLLEPLRFTVRSFEGPVLAVDEPVVLAVGDVFVLRLHLLYTVRGLDGATATTLPPVLERAFVRAAAGEAVAAVMERVILGRDPVSEDALEPLRRLAGSLRSQADALLGATRGGTGVMPWLTAV